MPAESLDRSQIHFHPVRERENRVHIVVDHVTPAEAPEALTAEAAQAIALLAQRLRRARELGRARVLAFGAHSIKNGLGPVLIRLMESGWLTHLATNGAGIIHDWEFAFLGASSENVQENVAQGRFGIWEETGHNLNLALLLGAADGLGYGESVGRLIEHEAHVIPERADLLARIAAAGESPAAAERAAGAADLLALCGRHGLAAGRVAVPHPFRRFSVQAAAYRQGLPFTAHPMFGHDIIYTHPLNCGAAIGRAAERDFLAFAAQIRNLEDGVYMSVGSAVMSPMIFEKSLSMSRNLELQAGRRIERHFIAVVDLAKLTWDWRQGEPPESSPDYYLRFCKTFRRMGGEMRYISADNRDFFLGLCRELGVH